tara:strand:- start:24929 stop:25597 length:669 start_codon:yes stop_codon:yes gene_type:complete
MSSQQTYSKPIYYDWFDTTIGKTNTSIFQGMEYVEAYPMAENKHRFFEDFQFTQGSINFDEQDYYNVFYKYDAFGDQIILKASQLTGASAILLTKEKIKTFTIGEHHFLNLKENNPKINNGFYEILENNEFFTIYKKYRKKVTKKLDKVYAYYSFIDKYEYFVFYKNDYYAIKSPKDLGSIFKSKKDFIKKSIKKNSESKNTTIDENMILVAKDLYDYLLAN